jgi:hypothetical protein
MLKPTNVFIIKYVIVLAFLGIFAAAATGLLAPASFAQAKQDPAAAKPGQQPATVPAATTEKTAEQVYKNIKVLTGMPAGQVMMAMNFMRASLGVNCAFCHVQKDGNWDFAADDKREKGTARKMIEMVVGINKDSFSGQTRVSCFTCHQGHEHTTGMPPLPQAAEGGPGGPEPGPARPAADTLPTADQLFDKFTQALGGQPALDKVKSRTLKATQTTTDGRSMNVEVTEAAAGKIVETDTPQQGTMMRGFDGTNGWAKNPRGVQDLTGDPLNGFLRMRTLNWPQSLKAQFVNPRVAGKDKVGDHDVYVLFAQISDSQRARLFFDVQTGLLLRETISDRSLVGNIPSQIDYEDYRDVDGLKLPFTIRLSLVDPWSSWTRKYSEIKSNAPVNDKVFARPEAPKP